MHVAFCMLHFVCCTILLRTCHARQPKATTVKMLEYEREFLCTKCKHLFTVAADFEQCYALAPPARCPGDPGEDPCDSSKFKCTQDVLSNPTSCRDYQEVKVQEQISKCVCTEDYKPPQTARTVLGGRVHTYLIHAHSKHAHIITGATH